MTENYKKVLEFVSKNEELKNKITEVNENETSSVEETLYKVNSLIGEYGLSLSLEDLNATADMDELSDDELTNASGGGMIKMGFEYYTTDCLCIVGGGGDADEFQKTCACVLAGTGHLTEKGKYEQNCGRINTIAKGVAIRCFGIG